LKKNRKTQKENLFREDFNKLAGQKTWAVKLFKFLSIKKKNFTDEEIEEIRNFFVKKLEEEDFRESFYTEFAYKLSLSPIEVEKILNCTKAERLRWTKENLLPVFTIKRISVRDMSKRAECPFYNNLKIYDIFIENKIEEWRESYREKVKENKLEGIKKRKITLEKRKVALERSKKTENQIKNKEVVTLRIYGDTKEKLDYLEELRNEPLINILELIVHQAYYNRLRTRQRIMSDFGMNRGRNSCFKEERKKYITIKIYVHTEKKLQILCDLEHAGKPKLIDTLISEW